MRASVQASQPDSPSRVRNVCRIEYSTKGRTFDSLTALLCCFFRLDASMCPLKVGAIHTQHSNGRPAASQRVSRIVLTLGVIGSTRRAAAVFPCVTSNVPLRPLTQVMPSHLMR